MLVALMLLGEGKVELARAFLQPVAVNPHGGRLAANAQKVIEKLAGLADGTMINSPAEHEALQAAVSGAADDGDDDDDDDESAG